MENIYLTIEIDGQENIGFINAGSIDIHNPTTMSETLKSYVMPKLREAIESHFDELTFITNMRISQTTILQVKFTAIIKNDGKDIQEEVTLNRTWLY